MTNSFATIMEGVRLAQQEKKNRENLAQRVIQKGLNIDDYFWENFMLLLEDSEGLSALLNIPELKINGWYDKIQNHLNSNNKDAFEIEVPSKRRIIST